MDGQDYSVSRFLENLFKNTETGSSFAHYE